MNTFHSVMIAAAVGALAGTHAAIWGMYKDAAHEGFEWPRFLRSVVLGAVCAVIIQTLLRLPLPAASGLFVLFGSAYAAERALVEVWKTFVREEDQSKYFIPMQFSFRGVPVADRRVRLGAGAAYVIIVLLCLVATARLHMPPDTLEAMSRAGVVGLAAGLVIAIGGGWKDAPKEGFDLVKFFRSPIMTVIYAVVASRLTGSYLLVAATAIGLERATAETYKTFFFPSKPRGKFSGKPVHYPDMLRRRQFFVPAYVAISAAAIVCMLVAVGGGV